MTEAVVDQRNTVSATGFANPLNLPANAEAASHVKVYGDDVLLTNGPDYTLAGVGDVGDLDEIAGVNVTIDADVLAADLYDEFTVVHSPPVDQDHSLSSGGTLGRIYEAALDAIMRRVQPLATLISRALHLPPGIEGVTTQLPRPDPGMALKWNAAGTALINTLADPDTEGLVEAAAFADAAEASAATATAQATIATNAATAASASEAAAAQSALDAAAAAGDVEAVLAALEAAKLPIGSSFMFNGTSAPVGGLKENGAAVSRTTYDKLWVALHTEATVTITIATPAVVSWTAHGLVAGETVRLYTTGALPTGLSANTTYYVISAGLTADAFQLSLTAGGAAINTSGVQSGVHTAHNAPNGYGDGTTTFNVPESRGEFFRGLDDGRGIDTGRLIGSAQSEMVGSHDHTASMVSAGSHTHTVTMTANARYGANSSAAVEEDFGTGDTIKGSGSRNMSVTTTGSHTHAITVNASSGTENRPRNKAKLMCIKY